MSGSTTAQPVEYEQVTYNSTSGAQIGNATTTKVAFFGKTPVSQITISANHAITSFISTAGIYGFATSTQANLLSAEVSTMAEALRSMGIIV